MIGRKIWALIAAAILLAALIGSVWALARPDPTPTGDSGLRIGRSLPAAPRVLSPVGLEIGADEGPGPYRLKPGEELILLAAVELDDGSTRYDAPINWASTDPRVAAIGPTGLLRAIAGGQVTITAELAPLEAEVGVRVDD